MDQNNITRQHANFEILEYLSAYFTAYPNMRFGQALSNLGIATHKLVYANPSANEEKDYFKDVFFEESAATLSHLKSMLVPSE